MRYSADIKYDDVKTITDSVLIKENAYQALAHMPLESSWRASRAILDLGFTGECETYDDPAVDQIIRILGPLVAQGVKSHLAYSEAGKKGAHVGDKCGAPTKEMKRVLKYWNRFAEEHSLPQQDHLNGVLISYLKQLFSDGENPETIESCLENKVAKSPYCMGKNNQSIKIHFEWFLRKFHDIQSGKYDGNGEDNFHKDLWKYSDRPF